MSPGYPFSSLVLNINVMTSGHRDGQDLKACLVMAIGDHEGGELCLMEPGLVIPLRSGDLIIFRSCDVTHFNLHYKGFRASMVLHSDRHGEKWAKNCNKWDRNKYFG